MAQQENEGIYQQFFGRIDIQYLLRNESGRAFQKLKQGPLLMIYFHTTYKRCSQKLQQGGIAGRRPCLFLHL